MKEAVLRAVEPQGSIHMVHHLPGGTGGRAIDGAAGKQPELQGQVAALGPWPAEKVL